MAEKKFYWLKLQRDFFKRHDVRVIEEMENGKDYLLFYLKLLVESLDHEGHLRFSDTVPYNDKMLAVVTNTNVDIVRSALKVFSQLNMIEILEDETIYMTEVEKMIGSETEWAEKKRIYRENQRLLEDRTNRGQKKTMSDKSKSIDIELDIEKDKELEKEIIPPLSPQGEWNFDKHTNVDNLKHILNNSLFEDTEYLRNNQEVYEAIKTWMEYKDAKKPKLQHHYSNDRSINALLKKFVKYARDNGSWTVQEVVDNTMSNNYQGIVWNYKEKQIKQSGGSQFDGV